MTWGLLRHGAMNAVFGGIHGPSTLGSHLRSYTWGNVAQLEKASREFLADGALCPSAHRHCRDPGTLHRELPRTVENCRDLSRRSTGMHGIFPLVKKTDAQDAPSGNEDQQAPDPSGSKPVFRLCYD